MNHEAQVVAGYARQWWESKRPREWTKARHMRSPTKNCHTRADRELARAVADYLTPVVVMHDV